MLLFVCLELFPSHVFSCDTITIEEDGQKHDEKVCVPI